MPESLFMTTETVRDHRRDLARLSAPRGTGVRLFAGFKPASRRARATRRSGN